MLIQPASALLAASLALGASDRHVTTATNWCAQTKLIPTLTDHPRNTYFRPKQQNAKQRFFFTGEQESVLDWGEGHVHVHYVWTPTQL